MPDIPRAVLSEQIEEHLGGRRLLAAVFVTFRFEPEFFEQQVLPVFLNVATSHSEAIRRVQLEDVLKDVRHRVAVYYDQNGLAPNAGPARQDVSRVPIVHRTGIFHPKNVFALVEELDPDNDGHRAQSLVVACMSANLTRAGWWENVEVCHIETIAQGEGTRLKEDLFRFLEGLERKAGDKAADGHASIKAIKSFLRTTDQRLVRSSGGRLHTHFFDGTTTVPKFIREATGSAIDGLYLEVISPYFDAGPESKPLSDLIAEFAPKEVRVFLPRKETGEALCSAELFEWVRLQSDVSWGRLPKDVIRGGKSDDVKSRTVHAKVYRFFQANPKREYLFVGSVNLTGPAHRKGGNLETGFLVELDPVCRPDWWLEADRTKPTIYEPRGEDEGAASTAGSRLSLRYWWDSKRAEAYWDSGEKSPRLQISRGGVPLFAVDPILARQWVQLETSNATAIKGTLQSTSIFMVEGDRPEPAAVLVQEEGMTQRPSLLFDLTPAEILRYWSLLTTEQRAAFLEAHAPEIALTGEGADLVAKHERLDDRDSFFDRFAGIFISFGQLEQSVRESLAAGKDRAAEYRMFGQKYDSLGRLLTRIQDDGAKNTDNLIEHYVMALCARQMVTELRNDWPHFFGKHPEEAKRLEQQLGIAVELRARLSEGKNRTMAEFLLWFEEWFLKRAKPVKQEAEA
ncbi:conserved hypothetical protein [Candidatus Nitrospira nitrosa]|uniref:Uncharacterized protein n=1 Tax=Candidatus Nitrospira nitrosa TaxID=1742972 RepID=A0A0S4LM77_9BACT|nr:hypothetical protein [Candidatus Nitrospira nitrosa]CUS37805.1 conserved hypothetical protein [Candidatus Nitrospira nitrosa]